MASLRAFRILALTRFLIDLPVPSRFTRAWLFTRA